MKVHPNYDSFKAKKTAVTSGIFDGVHLGHQEILASVKKAAKSIRGESVVVTFWPHPKEILHKDQPVRLINTIDEKIELLEKSGIDHLVIIPFTYEFSKLTAKEYITHVLVNKLNLNHLVIGFNHHFGHDRLGNFETLALYAAQNNFTAEQLTAKTIRNNSISSTIIRKIILDGNVSLAKEYLGYSYPLSGIVVQGNKIGRTIGFPTANISEINPLKIIPPIGVYAVWAKVNNAKFPGMLNIGYRPTLNDAKPSLTIEVNLMNFSEDIYGKEITIFFEKRIRNEIKFEGLAQLTQQLSKDKNEVSQTLGIK